MIDRFDPKYYALQQYVNVVFRLHFRKLVITGKENIPKGKPVIYAPTHRNALVDALILVYENVAQQVVFLARADIFKKPLVVKILHFLRIMPVYRLRDGQDNLSKNQEIFETCGRILQNGNPICLFPEAKYNPHQSLLPLQKAIPRIALPTETASNFLLDTHIVPIAFYYTAKDNYLADLYVTYGKPVRVADYKTLYEEEPNLAINKLRQDLDKRLRSYVVDIPAENYEEYEALIDTNADDSPEGVVVGGQKIIEQLNRLKADNHADYAQKMASVKEAITILAKNGLTTKDSIKKPMKNPLLFLRGLLLALSSPFAFAGLLNTIFPILIYKKILRLFKDKQFISSVRIMIGIFIVPLFYLLQAVAVGFIAGSFMSALIYILASPLLFIFGSYWRLGVKRLIRQRKVNRFAKSDNTSWQQVYKALDMRVD